MTSYIRYIKIKASQILLIYILLQHVILFKIKTSFKRPVVGSLC
ncbi:hypothetical protein Flavo103_01010 [Flavobacterium collinsii]|nr:hypothetical protein Flavo103_01010 [Flavobacterium collinsii]